MGGRGRTGEGEGRGNSGEIEKEGQKGEEGEREESGEESTAATNITVSSPQKQEQGEEQEGEKIGDHLLVRKLSRSESTRTLTDEKEREGLERRSSARDLGRLEREKGKQRSISATELVKIENEGEPERKESEVVENSPVDSSLLSTSPLLSSSPASPSTLSTNSPPQQEEETPESKLEKMKTLRFYIASELLSTEEAYISNLKLIMNIFLNPLKAQFNIPSQFFSIEVSFYVFFLLYSFFFFQFSSFILFAQNLFSFFLLSLHFSISLSLSLQILIGVNEVLYKELQTRLETWSFETKIGDVMMGLAPYLKMYSTYAMKYEVALGEYMKMLGENSNFAKAHANCAKSVDSKLSFESLVIQPIQRIPRLNSLYWRSLLFCIVSLFFSFFFLSLFFLSIGRICWCFFPSFSFLISSLSSLISISCSSLSQIQFTPSRSPLQNTRRPS